MLPDIIPDEVKELFQHLMIYAHHGDLGVISTLDFDGRTRFTLFGRHFTDEGPKLVPLGFLSTTAGDEVIPPGMEPDFVLEPERFDEWMVQELAHLDRWADDGGPPHDG